MIDFLLAIFLWLISFLLYSMNNHYWLLCKKACLRTSSNSFYIDLVFQIFRFRIILFYILPSVTRFVFNWENDKLDHVTSMEISVVYLLELLSHFIYYLSFLFLLKKNKYDLSLEYKCNAILNYIVLACLLLYCYFSITGFNLFADEEAPSDSLWIIRPLIMAVGSVMCFYVLVLGTKYWKKSIVFVSFFSVILYLILSFFSGVRGKVFWPILWMIFCVCYFRKDQIKRYLYFGAVILVILAIFQGGMTAFRSGEASDVKEIIDGISSAKDKSERTLYKEIDYRFGSLTRYSVGFLRMAERGYYAGLNPILNSLYSPIPRVIMPDKPVPCSVDGELHGMGMYLCVSEITKGESLSMVEFSTASHAYWELGIIGLLLFSFIPSLYVYLSILFFRRMDLLGPCFLFAIFKPWGYNDPKIWVSEIIMQIPQLYLGSYCFIFIYRRLSKIKKTMGCSQLERQRKMLCR